MGTATTDMEQARSIVPENDWPDFVESPVFVRYEDDQFIALLERVLNGLDAK
jgi:hypothetical protein